MKKSINSPETYQENAPDGSCIGPVFVLTKAYRAGASIYPLAEEGGHFVISIVSEIPFETESLGVKWLGNWSSTGLTEIGK